MTTLKRDARIAGLVYLALTLVGPFALSIFRAHCSFTATRRRLRSVLQRTTCFFAWAFSAMC